MNIMVQYPMTDCRLFLHRSGKLSKPYFVSPDLEGQEYIRYFGAMQGRHFQQYHYCVGENTFCNAGHALRFSQRSVFYRDKPLALRRSENRFYSDGGIMGKFEVKSIYRLQPAHIPADSREVYKMLLDFHLSHVVRVNDRQGGSVSTAFTQAGPALANLYLHGSTACAARKDVRKYWVQAGQPIIVLEEHVKNRGEFPVLPDDAREVRLKDQWHVQYLKLYHYVHEGTPCWIIEILSNRPEAKEMSRKLKTLLLRIHAEKQSLIKALEFLAVNRDNVEVDLPKAAHFIKNTLGKLHKGRRFNLQQNQIVNIAFEADDSFSQHDYRRLRQVVMDLNNRYIIEDFDCLFAQVDFDALCEAYYDQLNQPGNTIPEEIRESLGEVIHQGNKLEFKKYVQKYRSIIDGCASSALFELIKCGAGFVIGGM